MHLVTKLVGTEQIKGDLMLGMFVTLTPDILASTERVEVWGSGFNDAGGDFCEIRFFKANEDKPFKVNRTAGY